MIFADFACFRLFLVVLQSCSIDFVLRYVFLFCFFRSFSSAGASVGKWVAASVACFTVIAVSSCFSDVAL